MRSPYALCAAVAAAAALFALPGCSRVVAGNAVQGAGGVSANSAACEHVSAPLTPIQAHGAGEPQLRIPQPPGWQRSSMLDSEIIRFAMGNQRLTADKFTPTAVVTLESVPGMTQDRQKIFEEERATLVDRLGATDMHSTETSRCGQAAVMASFNAPAMGRIPSRKAKTLMVFGAFSGRTYVVTVTVQSTDPDNPTYARDTQTILTGFQMLPPDAG
ncbi:LpqN/LpqT family lipoprotein [Mycobacterium celatum]|uniref:Lipoprotein LpqN n=1 Tax=Mycobacterium celatum TaxID=28045 RepID=A0A1X1RMZ7_MYCCE|nr:LpqN/LpqT family lipoprotein [Mycobacterium celatum]ORV09991.1 hypothetical protein AWB95_17430 [Mycobacterium celatum]PIB75458.1 hypothetical protein CQY23_19735 [Mycobacterium celatum]